MRTVVEAMAAAASDAGTLTTFRGGDELVVRWAQVHDRARRMATFMSKMDIALGSRVALIGDTSVDMMVAIQAVWLSGAAVSVLPPAPRRSDPASRNAIFADARFDIVLADGEADLYPVRALSLPKVVEESRALPAKRLIPPDPADLAILQYTSGSTSDPRGVPVTHGHLAANLDAIKGAFGYGGEAVRMLSWLPLYHDMGLIGFACLPMACGWTLLLQTPASFALRPMSWLEAASRHRITTTGAPNFAFRLVTSLLEANTELDLSPLRFLLCGAEPISAEGLARFAAAGRRCGLDPAAIVPAYGLAEATLAASISPPGTGVVVDRVQPDALQREGYARPAAGAAARCLVMLGPPVPGTEIRVADPESGAPAPSRQIGRIEVRGSSVVGHYWGEPPPPPGSWFNTGDLGYLADGELVVCGRQKDVLFCAGRNVYPQDVEVAAARVPAVRAGGAVAFGVPSDPEDPSHPEDPGDRLIVAVEFRGTDARGVRRAVAAAVSEETGMRPADVVALTPGRIPKTSSGKLRRAEARRRYLCGELASKGKVQ